MRPGMGWGSAASVFASLAGCWRLQRQIATAEGSAAFSGEALFLPGAGDSLIYRENGRLRLPDGTELDAEQSYVFLKECDGFSILFPSTRLLFQKVSLTPSGTLLSGTATHACGEDVYDSRYAFEPDGGFRIRHRVAGPRKDYVSDTRHIRADS